MKHLTLEFKFYLFNDEYQITDILIDNMRKNNFVACFYTEFEDITYYVNDLDKAYIYLINYLLRNEFKCTNDSVLRQNTFSYVYKSGKCSNIKVKTKYANIIFVNFKSKFGVEFGTHQQNQELIDYAIQHKRLHYSLGADAYNEFVMTQFNPGRYSEFTAHRIMRTETHYPIFEYSKEMLEAKNNASGYQMCKAGTYQNIYEYDISSSYPAQLLCNTPVGLPKYYNNLSEVPETYFKIITFTYYNNKGVKPNKIDFIQTSIMGEISLTEKLFNLFIANYDCEILIKSVIAFKTQKSPFAKFIYNNIINGKLNEPRQYIAKYNKYIGNAIIGYFGRNTTTTENLAEMEKKLLKTTTVDKTIEPMYLPVYLSVLDKAKTAFINTLEKLGNSIIYANTDGFLTNKEIDTNMLNISNSLPIGNYRNKNNYAQIHIECINGYAGIKDTGEIENTISGMTLEDVITPAQYQQRHFTYYVNVPTENGTIRRQRIQPI